MKGVLLMLVEVWPLWLLLGAVAFAKAAYAVYEQRRLSRSGIVEIDAMDGRTFEVYLSTLFRRLGYTVEVTRYRGDYGADLVVRKDGRKTAVQAKRWKKAVGVKAVQEVVASKAMYECERALVVANRSFTQQARRLAHRNAVELWDREVLVKKLLSVRVADQVAAQPAPVDVTHCARCGDAVSEKVREYCLARPARFGGLVYCFAHQRDVVASPSRP